MNKSRNQLRMLVYSSLMAALTSVGAYIIIPIGPVPIVLQNLFVMLSGILLGSQGGVITISVYLLAGACGLPVFSGGLGGVSRIIGPTGGYLIGYLPCVFIIGFIVEKTKKSIITDVIAMLCGLIIVYLFGVTWLKVLTGMTWIKTLTIGMFPFILGDVLKIIAAIPIAKALKPIINKDIY